MHRLLALIAFAATLSGVAAAHDFWMDLGRWSGTGPAAKVHVSFHAGHAADARPWILSPDRRVRLVSIGPTGRQDQQDALIFPTAGDKSGAALSLAGAGVHVIAFETDNAFSELAAEKFNAYLAEEGLQPALDARRKGGRENDKGRELYSRRAKAFIQIGRAPAVSPPAAVGQTLEIVPLESPFAPKQGAPLRVRIDYQGRPLSGATVSLENLDIALWPETRRKTGADGVAAFDLPHRGAWKLNVVWTRAIGEDEPDAARADFETVFSSLTFGY